MTKLIDFLDDWIENYHRQYVKHQTYVRYKSSINNYIRKSRIAEMDIKEITRKDIQDFVNGMTKIKGEHTQKPLAPGTINNTFIVLQCAFGYAEDFEFIEKNPCTRIRRVPKNTTPAETVKCFTVEEQKQIEKYIDSLNNFEYYGFILCLYTGLRIGELCALTWDDIDFDNGILHVNKTVYVSLNEEGQWRHMVDRPKTKTSRRDIPLPNHVLAALKKGKAGIKSEYVCRLNSGAPMETYNCRLRYNHMLEELGIRHISFHALRHTFATRAIENGMDVKTLSEILGHSNPSVTLSVYTHSMNDHKRNMMNMMQRIG